MDIQIIEKGLRQAQTDIRQAQTDHCNSLFKRSVTLSLSKRQTEKRILNYF